MTIPRLLFVLQNEKDRAHQRVAGISAAIYGMDINPDVASLIRILVQMNEKGRASARPFCARFR
jgi:hypothetical protein